MNKQEAPHISVMPDEFLEGFASVNLRTFFDGTLGAGGHAEALLKAHPEIEMYIGCDRDQSAIEIAKKRLASWKKKIVYVHGNYRDLDKYLKQQKIKAVDGFFLI